MYRHQIAWHLSDGVVCICKLCNGAGMSTSGCVGTTSTTHCAVVHLCLQLNVRKLLEDSKMPAINIICQKVATEGLTRFEDRHRLPLGISVNLNSFAAKMLAQVTTV